jgi:NADH dehydrogenase FAD-containing subunit
MKKVVIVGGGFAGSLIAKKLQSVCAITLIDTKSYFEFTPSILKIVRDPTIAKKIRVQHTKYLKKGTFIEGKVTKITEKNIYIGEKEIAFDFLILAIGWKYKLLKSEIPALNVSDLYQKKLLKKPSQKVLIIGGGAVGVELAAELPPNQVIIADISDHLLARLNRKAGSYAQKYLERKGSKIILGQAIVDYKEKKYVTNTKKKISADYAIACAGFMPHSELVKDFAPASLDSNGFVSVNRYFQLAGKKNIFAVGNISSISNDKSAQNAEKEASLFVSNMRRLLSNNKMKPYVPKERPTLISLGPYDGMLIYKKLLLTGILPVLMKKIVELKTLWRYKYL